MARKISRAVSVTFYDNGESKIEMTGNWLRRDLDSIPIMMRKEIARQRVKTRVITKETSDD